MWCKTSLFKEMCDYRIRAIALLKMILREQSNFPSGFWSSSPEITLYTLMSVDIDRIDEEIKQRVWLWRKVVGRRHSETSEFESIRSWKLTNFTAGRNELWQQRMVEVWGVSLSFLSHSTILGNSDVWVRLENYLWHPHHSWYLTHHLRITENTTETSTMKTTGPRGVMKYEAT